MRLRRSLLVILPAVGLLLCGCPEHPNALFVKNVSSKAISVKITGFKKPWTSKPIAPGGQEVVDRYANDSEDKIQVAFFDTASGHLLLKQSFGSEMIDESLWSNYQLLKWGSIHLQQLDALR